MVNERVLVTGATGNTGSALLDLLVERSAPVVAMVRDGAGRAKVRADVPVVVADFDDAEAVAAALAGVGAAYLVTPSSERAQEQQERFAELAASAGVRHLVKLSQLAAAEDSPVRFLRYHAAVERRIRELGIGYTFLRPNLYFQGLLNVRASIAAQGTFFAPIGDARISAVDVRDIAAVAAVALTEPGHDGRTYTITGPAAVTHAEIAAEIGAATGRRVAFVDVEPAAFADALRGMLPDWQVDGLVEDYAHYARGEAAAVDPAVSEVTGRAPRGLSEFAKDHAAAFTAQ
ncbi:NmrA family NAD(P)-binding protein [Actinomycetes bacterium KLBMP 9759]